MVAEVELLQGLPGRETGGPDADLPAVGLAARHLPLEPGSQELSTVTEFSDGALSAGRSKAWARDGSFKARPKVDLVIWLPRVELHHLARCVMGALAGIRHRNNGQSSATRSRRTVMP